MNDDLTPIEEQALDALLVETLAGAGPPNMSDQILGRLRNIQSNVSSIVPAEPLKRESPSSSQKQIAIALTVVATLAASMLVAIWLRSDRQGHSPLQSVAGSPHTSNFPDDFDPFVDPISHDGASPLLEMSPKLADTTPRKPPRGIPLVMRSPPNDDQPTDSPLSIDLQASPESAQIGTVTLVSTQVDSELQAYWDAIGIEPSDDAVADEIIQRLSVVLRVDLPVQSLDQPQQLQVQLANPVNSRAIAGSWLRQITAGGVLRLDQQAKDSLIEELAACFRAEQGFDRTLSGWIGGQSPSASAFYQAISSDDSAMARRLAALTMNVDLRCTRCHESYIEGNGRQQDFWAYSAFLHRGVTRGPRGQLTIDATANGANPLFYELPDGRQRVVEPAIAATWMASQANQPIAGVREWAERLIGSPELAHGVVNSLWQLIHGRPLRGRVVDPFSAPHNESLVRLEESLVQDLIRSRFDVSRTLALIIASPATERAVPAPLRPENSLVADESEIRKAQNAVNAFAAAMPVRTDLPIRQRLDMAMRAIGAKLGADGRAIVAQIGPGTDKPSSPDADRSLADDFPDRGDSYPVQWLTQIKDQTSRVEHLAYLAGFSQVPNGVLEAAEATRAANASDELTLQRVWWLLRQ